MLRANRISRDPFPTLRHTLFGLLRERDRARAPPLLSPTHKAWARGPLKYPLNRERKPYLRKATADNGCSCNIAAHMQRRPSSNISRPLIVQRVSICGFPTYTAPPPGGNNPFAELSLRQRAAAIRPSRFITEPPQIIAAAQSLKHLVNLGHDNLLDLFARPHLTRRSNLAGDHQCTLAKRRHQPGLLPFRLLDRHRLTLQDLQPRLTLRSLRQRCTCTR
jgi:hypothetical protein